MFLKWAYEGTVDKCVTSFKLTNADQYSNLQMEIMEATLLAKFNEHLEKLVDLYAFGEKYGINDLMNRAIDNVQDGYKDYGTVFGYELFFSCLLDTLLTISSPGLATRIFRATKPDSLLRDLCVGGILIHFDRGCSKLRDETMSLCMSIPDYFPHMLKWIARNFAMFSKRVQVGFSVKEGNETFKGFSMFNRALLCPCHFHVHAPGKLSTLHPGAILTILRSCPQGS